MLKAIDRAGLHNIAMDLRIESMHAIMNMISKEFESYRSEAESVARPDAAYQGHRICPRYVARYLALHRDLTVKTVTRTDIVEAVHYAASAEYDYQDRENRG